MVNTIPLSSSPIINSTLVTPSKDPLGGSIDKDYQPRLEDLFREYNLSDPKETILCKSIENLGLSNNTSSKESDTASKVSTLIAPAHEKLEWSPQLDQLFVDNQLTTINELLLTLKNTTFNGENNIKSIPNQLNVNLTKSTSYLQKLQQLLQAAVKMGGGNLSLIESYQKTLKQITPYVSFLNKIKTLLSNDLPTLFSEIEPDTLLLSREIATCMDQFKNSITTENIINDFSDAEGIVKNLISLTENPKIDLKGPIKEATALIALLQERKSAVENYLRGPADPYLYLKNPAEFTAEIAELADNIAFLEKLLLKLETSHTVVSSLNDQLKTLETNILELCQLNFQFVIGEYQASASNAVVPTYNGHNLAILLN